MFDVVLEIGEAWLPVELKLDLVGAGDEDVQIAPAVTP
jgi:hypothetical protein